MSIFQKFACVALVFCNTVFCGNFVTLCSIADQLAGQLFFTAMALGFAWEHDLIVAIPMETYLNAPNGKLNYQLLFHRCTVPNATQILSRENIQHYTSLPKEMNQGTICLSQVQPELRYFDEYRAQIRELFSVPQTVLEEIKRKYMDVLNHPKTVAVHIRTYHPLKCGDHGFLGEEYYKNAMRRFSNDHLFVIFSDRIKWCKKKFSNTMPNTIFVENNNHITDLYLMSMCKNIITANSGFSWWAAYLKTNLYGRVLVPSRWLISQATYGMQERNFYPSEWEVIPVTNFPAPNLELLQFPTSSVSEQ